MGMTIDKSITELEILKKNTFSYMSAYQAFTTAINIMCKYQKIQEIMTKRPKDMIRSNPTLRAINEVLEDGKIDRC